MSPDHEMPATTPEPGEVAAAMWGDDNASRAAGLELLSVGLGSAEMALVVDERHVNGLGVCHGGYLFLLADSAMAFASNSRNDRAVAAAAHIDFVRPAALGDRLVATARERSIGKRTGLYDCEVRRGGELVALFHGRTATTGGQVIQP